MVPADAFFRGCVMQLMERSHLVRLQALNQQMLTADVDDRPHLFEQKQALVQSMREHGLLRRPGFLSAAVGDSSDR
jgi:hypothetical protein